MFNHHRLKNYIAGIGTGSFRMLLQVVVGLWLTPFILRYLDRQEFGIFSLTLEVLTWLTLLDIGITAGLRAQAARFDNRTEQEKINRLASTAFFAQNFIVCVVFVGGLALAYFFPHFFPFDLIYIMTRRLSWLCVFWGVAVRSRARHFLLFSWQISKCMWIT